MQMPNKYVTSLFGFLFFFLTSYSFSSDIDDIYEFSDRPLTDLNIHPSWFKESFLALDEDLEEAIANNKKGIIVYFGQKRCAYCRQLLEINLKLPDIEQYIQKHFDVIAIDIWSPEEVTTPEGESLTQRQYAKNMGTDFTPSLIFYNAKGEIALRLRGYYPPYQFRAALEYVADSHYQREKFSDYMARGDSTLRFEAEDMVEESFFMQPPFNLSRKYFKAETPLAVFFEQGECHACDILHTGPLQKRTILKPISQFESIQVNMWSDTPIIKPDGATTTAKAWAKELGIFYAPSVVFFDESGKEIIRVDSVVQMFRLRNTLNYILDKGYETFDSFQDWRKSSLH